VLSRGAQKCACSGLGIVHASSPLKLTRYAPPRFRLCLFSGAEELERKETDVAKEKKEAIDSEKDNGGDDSMDTGNVRAEHVANPEGLEAGNPPTDVTVSAHSCAVDRYVLRQYVADVLDNFVSDHVKSAERLLTVPMLVAANDIIVESVFSELCSIPMPAFPSLYYRTVFVDLCKVKDLRLPIKLITAVDKRFHEAGALGPEVFDRLTVLFTLRTEGREEQAIKYSGHVSREKQPITSELYSAKQT
jgi:hypothetical protein